MSEEKDTAVEIWSLFNQLESIIESLVVEDYRTVNASWRLAEARMWLEKLEVDEFLTVVENNKYRGEIFHRLVNR